MIEFNGKTYASVEEMPPEERKAYEAAMRLLAESDKKGLWELMKAARKAGGVHHEVTIRAMKIVVNGREYTSVEEMSPEDRSLYEQAMTNLEGSAEEGQEAPAVGVPSATEPGVSGPLEAAPSVMKEEPLLGLAPIVAVVLFLLALAVGFVLVMGFLR